MNQMDDDDLDLNLAAQADVTVLITAPSGDSREAFARFIHDHSLCRRGPFVTVDGQTSIDGDPGRRCHDTDQVVTAIRLRRHFEQARGGTLFIDDVAGMGAEAQAELFLLLEDGVLRPPAEPTRATARIIAGTSRPLLAEIAAGAFSESLFYRLNSIHVNALGPAREGPVLTVSDLMSSPAHSCRIDADLAKVARTMWDRDCGMVAVVDGSGRLAGVVTDRDICIATATRRLLPEGMTAGQVMTAAVQTVRAEESLDAVLVLMARHQIRRVPVVDSERRPRGVISLNDIVLSCQRMREPRPSQIVSVLAAICTHRQVETTIG
jgi:CBS domain-containing protein